jgi:hypothetical protein
LRYHLKRSTKLACDDEQQTEHELAGGRGTGRFCVTLNHIKPHFNTVNQTNELEDTKEAKKTHAGECAKRNTDTLLTRCQQ